jgi:regulator of replication initiation timing
MFEALITGVVGVIVAWLTHMITKKKYTSEVENSNIKNMHDSLDFYKELSDDQQSRITTFMDQNEGLAHKVELLEQQVRELKQVVENTEKLKQENQNIKDENQSLRLENQALRDKLDEILSINVLPVEVKPKKNTKKKKSD